MGNAREQSRFNYSFSVSVTKTSIFEIYSPFGVHLTNIEGIPTFDRNVAPKQHNLTSKGSRFEFQSNTNDCFTKMLSNHGLNFTVTPMIIKQGLRGGHGRQFWSK